MGQNHVQGNLGSLQQIIEDEENSSVLAPLEVPAPVSNTGSKQCFQESLRKIETPISRSKSLRKIEDQNNPKEPQDSGSGPDYLEPNLKGSINNAPISLRGRGNNRTNSLMVGLMGSKNVDSNYESNLMM